MDIQQRFLIWSFMCTASSTGFPGGSDHRESSCSEETQVGSLGQGDAPGEGNGNSLQHSCLENAVNRGAWRVNPWGHKSQT